VADSSVLLEVIVEGKNIKLVQRSVEELGDSINKSSTATEKDTKSKKRNKKATDELAAGQKNFNKGQKGVAGATANGTKAFSKQRQAIGGGSSGLVGAYATLAANIFAATAAFGALQRAAQFQKLLEGFEAIAATSGRTSSIVVQSLKDITDGALSTEQAASAAAAGINAGFSTIEIERLAGVAKNASIALGRNLPDAIDRLVRGTAKIEPEILDELGIFVRLDDAVESYANTLGKSASTLSQAERRQAFLNATLEQGEQKFKILDGVVKPDVYTQLAASFDDLTKSALRVFSTIGGPIFSVLANNTTALVGTLVLFGSTIIGQIFPVLTKLGDKYIATADAAKRAAKDAKKENKAFVKSAKSDVVNTEALSKRGKFATFQAKLANKEKVSKQEILDTEKAINASLERKIKKIEKIKSGEIVITDKSRKTLKNHEDDLKALQKQQKALSNLVDAEEKRNEASLRLERNERRANQEGALGQRVSDIQGGGAFSGFGQASEGLKEYKEGFEDIKAEKIEFLQNNELLQKVQGKLGDRFGNLAQKLGGMGAKLGVASAGVRLFGAAVTNAIPVIGQILFVLGLLGQALVSIYKFVFPANKGLEQMATVQEGLAKKTEILNKTQANFINITRAQKVEKALAKKATSELGATVSALTAAERENIEAAVAAEAATRKFREEAKIAAGVMTETADGFQMATEEFRKFKAPLGESATFMERLQRALQKTIDPILIVAGMAGRLYVELVKFSATKILEYISGKFEMFKNVVMFLKDAFISILPSFDQIKAAVSAVGDVIGGILNKIVARLQGFANMILGPLNSAFQAFKETFPETAAAMEELANSLGSNIQAGYEAAVEVVSSSINVVTDVVKSGVDATIQGAKDAGKAITDAYKIEAGLQAGIQQLSDTLMEAAEANKVLENALKKEFGDAGIIGAFEKLIKEGMGVGEAMEIIQLRVNRVQTATTNLSNNIEGLGTSFQTLREQSNKFLQKFDKKNPLTDLDTAARASVKALDSLQKSLVDAGQDSAEFNGLVAQNEELLKGFGLTVEDVAEKGSGALSGLISSLDDYNTAVKESKNDTEKLKAELKDLKVEFDAEKAVREFSAKVQGLAKTGKFEVSIKDQLKVRLENIEAEKAYLREKEKKEKELIVQQYRVINAELAVAKALMGSAEAITNAANGKPTPSPTGTSSGDTAATTGTEGTTGTASGDTASDAGGEGRTLSESEQRMADIEALIASNNAAMTAQQDSITAATDNAVDRLNEQALGARIEGGAAAVAAASQGDTMAERTESFTQAGGFGAIDDARAAGESALQMDFGRKFSELGPKPEDEEALKTWNAEFQNLVTNYQAGIDNIQTEAFRAKLEAVNAQMQPMLDNLRALGPDGELVATIAEGATTIADSIAVLGNAGADTASKIEAVGAIVGTIGAIAEASSNRKIAAVDKEIAAEKKRDGKSKESLAKIAALEKKKEALEKKKFNQQKKAKMAGVIIDTAAAIARAVAENPMMGGLPGSAIAAAMGAAQLAIISAQQYEGGGGSTPKATGPSSLSVGERKNTVDLAKSKSASGELAYMRGGSGMGGPENFQAMDKLPPKGAMMGGYIGRAAGGSVGYMVGEQGPELFVPEVPGTIVSEPDTRELTAPSQNVTFNINTIDSTGVSELITEQQGTIIDMLRQSSNSYGQPFMEDVDTAVFEISEPVRRA